MRTEDFTNDASGRLVKSTLGVLTFVPNPLPPVLQFDASLVRLIANAERALGGLNGVGQGLPNPKLLIVPFLRREAVLSSRIEGTVTDVGQLYLFEADPTRDHPDDALEVRNYVTALDYGLEAIRNGSPINLKLLRELHSLLLAGVRGQDKNPGVVRTRLVGIGGSNIPSAKYVAPCHTLLPELLNDLFAFLARDLESSIVVELALLHYQFEAIHPFNDGNGRIGRLLLTLRLAERQVLSQPLLYLSAFFEKERQAYYDGLYRVSTRGDWTTWIEFVALGIAEEAHDAQLRAASLLALRDDYRRLVGSLVRSGTAIQLVDSLLVTPYVTIAQAAEIMGVKFSTAKRTVDTFVQAGLLAEITGQARNRLYCAQAVIDLVGKDF